MPFKQIFASFLITGGEVGVGGWGGGGGHGCWGGGATHREKICSHLLMSTIRSLYRK